MRSQKRTPSTASPRIVNEVTTIPCAACELSFAAECGRDALILLIEHLRESKTEPKHRVEFDWMRSKVLLREIHGRNSSCRTRLKISNNAVTRY